jgi:hypothetical protein
MFQIGLIGDGSSAIFGTRMHHVGHGTFEVRMKRIMSDMERTKSGWNASCRTCNVASPDATRHVGHATLQVQMEHIMPDIVRSILRKKIFSGLTRWFL